MAREYILVPVQTSRLKSFSDMETLTEYLDTHRYSDHSTIIITDEPPIHIVDGERKYQMGVSQLTGAEIRALMTKRAT